LPNVFEELEMANLPLAYQITFGTYGTRLHGDYRATVVRTTNRRGAPVFGADPLRLKCESNLMRFGAIIFRQQQRELIEASIPSICQRGGWDYRISAGRSWWADGGSVKSIWREDYLQNAFEYIRRQRATPE
jgi:hypothetical protein